MSENNHLNESNKKQEAIGFLGLVSKKHQLASLIDMSEGAEQLGFSELNAYFSARLFPGISTLMPNLVYCYMIFALTWKENKNHFEWSGKDDNAINEKLKEITSYKPANGKKLVECNKGFHGDVQESIIGTYRHFMERYGFFEKENLFGCLNAKISQKSYRYIQIRNCFFRGYSKTDYCTTMGVLSPVLLKIEQEDMIERCKLAIRADVENNQPLSLFDLIVCRYATGEVNKKDEPLPFFEKLSTDFRDKNKLILCSDYNENVELLRFYGLDEIFKSEDDKVSLRQKIQELLDCYEAARFVSVMEFYVKCRSNQLLLEKKREIWGIGNENTEDKNILDNVQKLSDKWPIKTAVQCPDKLEKAVDNNLKYVDKMKELWSFYLLLNDNKKGDVDGKIWKLMEANSTGATILNRKAINEYHDTFRWEYRPTEDMREKSKSAGTDKMCASYFVNEIFTKETNKNGE